MRGIQLFENSPTGLFSPVHNSKRLISSLNLYREPVFHQLHPTPAQYAERRKNFAKHMSPHSLLFLPAAERAHFSHDTFYRFRQDSLYYHLFGDVTPLRPEVAPPQTTSINCSPLTSALFMKSRNPAEQHVYTTFLFLPSAADIRPQDAAWGRLPPRPEALSFLETIPASHLSDREVALMPELGREYLVDSNDALTVYSVLRLCLKLLCEQKVAQLQEAFPHAEDARTWEKPVSMPHLLKDANPLPALLLQYPSHLNLNGTTRYAVQTACRGTTKGGWMCFSHPLQQLLQLIAAQEVQLQLRGNPSSSSSDDNNHISYAYIPAALPGEMNPQKPSSSTPERLELLRERAAAPIRVSATLPPSICHAMKTHKQTIPPGASLRQASRSASEVAWRYRACKSPQQVAQHMFSAGLTQLAFNAAFRAAAVNGPVSEADIQLAIEEVVLKLRRVFRQSGCDVQLGYVPVIASGPAATQVHYVENNRETDGRRNEFVRLDAGLEVARVSSDCTRTFPCGERGFPAPDVTRRKAYDGLLELQRGLLQRMRQGAPISDLSKHHVEQTRRLLGRLGVRPDVSVRPCDPDVLDSPSKDDVQRVLCPHAFGHLTGIDIHEEYPQPLPVERQVQLLAGGMIHTVEPGIYLPTEEQAAQRGYPPRCVPSELRGVGIQIEDDVLILPPGKQDSLSLWGLWTRREYLQALLVAHSEVRHWMRQLPLGPERRVDHHKGGDSCGGLCQSFDAVQDLINGELLAAGKMGALMEAGNTVQDHLHFVVGQRWAICGEKNASDNVLGDFAATLAQNYDRRREVWYPLDAVVLTACIPKDVIPIERTMGIQHQVNTNTFSE